MGKTLKSTGFVMYIATISTMTDIMMSATISKSSRKLGMGAISATTIARTAAGTANSLSVSSETFGPFNGAGGFTRNTCLRAGGGHLFPVRPGPELPISLKM